MAAVGRVNNSVYLPGPPLEREVASRREGVGGRARRRGGGGEGRFAGSGTATVYHDSVEGSEATAQYIDQRLHEANCTFSSGQRTLYMLVRHPHWQAARPQRRCRRRRTATRVPRQLSRCTHSGPLMPADGVMAGARRRRVDAPTVFQAQCLADAVPTGPPDAQLARAAGGLGGRRK
jgi:hypothetical protein